jgi:hypothetical protein
MVTQVAENYEHVPARFGSPPRFINASATASKHRGGCENLLDLFRGNGVTIDVLHSIKCPFQVIDAHAQVANAINIIMSRCKR